MRKMRKYQQLLINVEAEIHCGINIKDEINREELDESDLNMSTIGATAFIKVKEERTSYLEDEVLIKEKFFDKIKKSKAEEISNISSIL